MKIEASDAHGTSREDVCDVPISVSSERLELIVDITCDMIRSAPHDEEQHCIGTELSQASRIVRGRDQQDATTRSRGSEQELHVALEAFLIYGPFQAASPLIHPLTTATLPASRLGGVCLVRVRHD